MISCNLMGGLGNQLFQIAATIAFSLQNNIPFIFPYSEELVIGKVRPTYWNTLLSKLKNKTTFSNTEITMVELYHMPKYAERSFQYSPIPKYNNFMLDGYFQSYMYFVQYETEIFEMMGIRQQQFNLMFEFPEYFHNLETISLHFRLGDYKEKPEYHPIMPFEYYDNALLCISESKLKKSTILYFCEEEDNEHVEKIINKLKLKYDVYSFLKVNTSIPDWKQMILMSCCKTNVIANSSFSWWAAYLNTNIEKQVYYPHKWFGQNIGNVVTSDLFPSIGWTKVGF
jgi:hypothetical protein